MNAHQTDAQEVVPTAESTAFAATLRAWRLYKGMTQDELADISGVSKSSISQAERAFHQHPPKEITQSRIASALGIDVQRLREMPPKQSHLVVADIQAEKVARPDQLRNVIRVASSEHSLREADDIYLPSKWILGATDEPDKLTYLTITDAAMQPTINIGDVVILEPADIAAPGIYLVGQREGDTVSAIGIRRVTPTANGRIRLSCDNDRFDRTHPPSDEALMLGKVIRIIRSIVSE